MPLHHLPLSASPALRALVAAASSRTAQDTVAVPPAAVVPSKRVAPHAPARRLATPPKIDGKIEPGEWDAAYRIEGLRDRVTGQPTADATVVYSGYDDKYAYFAFRCFDAKPSGIVGREVTPNSNFDGEDTVTVYVNSQGNRTFDANAFTLNVLGTKSEEIAGGRASKREWRGEWRAATSRDDGGWTAEMAIPWTMLSYPRNVTAMGLNFQRFQTRTRIESSWANATQNPLPEYDGYWDGIAPPPPPRPRPNFLAYAAPEVGAGGLANRVGLDARYPITPTLNGLVSIAPDFRNIENFVAGINFTRTERFVEDARPFFTEGAGYFDLLPDAPYGSLFYSRRIGAFDAGAKAYGQVTPNVSLGSFATLSLAGPKSAVVHARRATSTSSVDAFVAGTNGFEAYGGDPGSNVSGGLALRRRIGGLSFVGSVAGEGGDGSGAESAGSLGYSYERPRIYAQGSYQLVSPGFAPSLAYVPWRDRRGFSQFAYLYKEIRRGAFRYADAQVALQDFRTRDGTLQQGGYSIGFSATTRRDVQLSVGRERTSYSGALDEVTAYGLGINVSNRFKQLFLSREEGIRNDRPSRFTQASASYRLGKRLDVGLSQSLLEYDGSSAQTIVTAGYLLSPTRSLSGRVILRDGGSNGYMAYRSAGAAGTELYVILGDPNAIRTQARLTVKVVLAF